MAPSQTKACALSTPQATSPSLETMGLSPEKLHIKENTYLSRKNKPDEKLVSSVHVTVIAAILNACASLYLVMEKHFRIFSDFNSKSDFLNQWLSEKWKKFC